MTLMKHGIIDSLILDYKIEIKIAITRFTIDHLCHTKRKQLLKPKANLSLSATETLSLI